MPLVRNGFQCLVFDYQGFGKSEGKPSQENVLDDALAALDYIKNRSDVKGTKLILYGQSLGGHLACVVAAKKQEMIDAFVIEGAFTAHEEIAAYIGSHRFLTPGFLARWIIPSKYDAIDYIERISIPKLIIHSTDDEVCPFYMGQQLYEKAKQPKDFWKISGMHVFAARLYPAEFVRRFKEMVK
jgi:fermentation-respiration switch protein FrsA (DUF1100 family)